MILTSVLTINLKSNIITLRSPEVGNSKLPERGNIRSTTISYLGARYDWFWMSETRNYVNSGSFPGGIPVPNFRWFREHMNTALCNLIASIQQILQLNNLKTTKTKQEIQVKAKQMECYKMSVNHYRSV